MDTFNQDLIDEIMSSSPKLNNDVVVIVVPYPSQSHLNQLLHLSCLIASYKIPVHYACLATHVQQARARFNETTSKEFTKIQFHELSIPDFVSPPRNPNSVSRFPSHIVFPFETFLHIRQLMSDFIKNISPTTRKLVIISDTAMCYTVQDGALLFNVKLYLFNPISAFTFYYNGLEVFPDESPDDILEGLPSSEGCVPPEILEMFMRQMNSCFDLADGVIYNSCRSIEGTYIDLTGLSGLTKNKPRWAVGPLNLGTSVEQKGLGTKHKCLEWLDEQIVNSVIYVSFGTTTTLTKEEIDELALGLEQSGQKFIWILRDADGEHASKLDEEKLVEFPKGFEERTKENGIVVRDWAPQLEILKHSSTGGFMSHCGWNSCLESITMGVPIVAWPMHSDQPRNGFLITDVLKVGVIVRKWEQRDELVISSVIAKAIMFLMTSEEGGAMRKRAENLGKLVREAVMEGGISRVELASFITHITK